MNKKIIIFGTGEIADLAYFYFTNDSSFQIAGFVADDQHIKEETFNNLPVVPFSNVDKLFPPSDYDAHVALSYRKLNLIRKEKYLQMKEKKYTLVSYICSKSTFWQDLSYGDNCFILEDQTIQPTVKIGNNVMIWSGNHIGHGSRIKDHSYLSSQICISGHTVIGESCFVGVNSTFKDFLTIGDRVFISMDASVTNDVANDSVVLGPKSSILDDKNQLAIKIKRKYFNL